MTDLTEQTRPTQTKRNCLSLHQKRDLAEWLKAQGDLTDKPLASVAVDASQVLHILITVANLKSVAKAWGIPLYQRHKPAPDQAAPIQIIHEKFDNVDKLIEQLQQDTATLAQAAIDHAGDERHQLIAGPKIHDIVMRYSTHPGDLFGDQSKGLAV